MPKEEVKEILGRSPDFGDNMIMRMIFEFKDINEEGMIVSYPDWEEDKLPQGMMDSGMVVTQPKWD